MSIWKAAAFWGGAFVSTFSCFSILTAQTCYASCPNSDEIKGAISERRLTLLETKAGLERLANGDASKPLTTASLFTVDLSDSQAVGSRVAELKRLLEVQKSAQYDDFRKCLSSRTTFEKELLGLESLERDVNKLRLTFLSLSEDQRQSLLAVYEQASAQHASLERLAEEKRAAESRSALAEDALRKAETSAQRAGTEDMRDLATARALVEKRRKDLADISVQWTRELEAITEKVGRMSEELSRDAAILSQGERASTPQVSAGYRAVTSTWRELVDLLFSRFDSKREVRSVPGSFPVPETVISRVGKDTKGVQDLLEAHSLMETERKNLIELKEKVEKQESEVSYRLLLGAGKLRAQFIDGLSRRGEAGQFALNDEYIADLSREIGLVPYRPLVIARGIVFEVKDQLSRGISGLLSLLNRLLVLLIFIFTPVATYLLLKRASTRLDDLRAWLIRSRSRYPKAGILALWIRRLNPYLPWGTLWVASKFARLTVKNTELEGFSEVLPYFEYFVLYRIFRLALSEVVVASASYSSFGRSGVFGPKIEKTAKFLGIYLLLTAWLLQATKSIARQALFYQLIWDLLIYLTPAWLAVAAFWWRKEISVAASELLPGSIAGRVSRLCLSKWAIWVCLPTTVLLFSVVLAKKAIAELSQFDSAKRVSAQLFRRKLESAAKGKLADAIKRAPGGDYLAYFELGAPSDLSLYVSTESGLQKSMIEAIENWRDGKTAEHTLAIQGEKGIGKSSLLRMLEEHFSDLKVLRASVPDKITDEKSLSEFLETNLSVSLAPGVGHLGNAASSSQKRLVLIDEGQNLFLAQRGGFRAFRAFVNLCNRSDTNLFWCVAINRYSWAYLNAVTGGSKYFRHVFEVEGWSDADIRSLIMSRHERTGYRLEFDPIIFAMEGATEREEVKLIQDRYFELLWDQSRGNPRAALILWISALEILGEKHLRVGVPAAAPSRPLAGLTDDELFVIAAVIRHENLTADEAQAVTSLSDAVVRHAFRVGIERGFLERSDTGRHRIRPLWQSPLTQTLVHKNFVYG